MIKRNIPPFLAFAGMSIFLFLAYLFTKHDCEALSRYRWTVQLGIGKFLFRVIYMCLTLLVGTVLFFLFRKKVSGINYGKIKFTWFLLLPVIVFLPYVQAIPHHITDAGIRSGICSKSFSDGSITQSRGLAIQEYEYLHQQLFLLPDIPASSTDIDLKYFHDGFLGDYYLQVQLFCNPGEPIDTAGTGWVVEPEQHRGQKKMRFEKAQN